MKTKPSSGETAKNQNRFRISPVTQAAMALAILAGGDLYVQHIHDGEMRSKLASEAVAEPDAKKVAKAIEDALNTGKVYEEAPVASGYSFAIDPEKMEEIGIRRISSPLVLGERSVGYIDIDQETNKVDVIIVDMSTGQFLDSQGNPSEPRFGDTDPVGPFGITLTEQDGSTVATLTNKGHSLVGQVEEFLPSAEL